MKQVHLTKSLLEVGAAPEREGLPVALIFPFAGGGGHSMNEWVVEFAPAWRTVVVQYPGRGRRQAEPFARSLRELAYAAVRDLLSLGMSAPLLIGHSMGALIAHCTATELQRHGASPQLLLASAGHPPHRGVPLSDVPLSVDLTDAELIKTLDARGGIHPQVRQERALLDLFLPQLRADLGLVREHLRRGNSAAVSCPLLAMGASGDEVSPPAELPHWSALTTGEFAQRTWKGGHFYFQHGLDGLAEEVRNMLQKHG
ncbi:thioesterase II family protein [Streptomyces alboniger]|uniref:Thioesterase n=1 Tax=Streptomyces alboniger TaxID=132473 RepID=A0A5J6HEE0_STRAD|nr:alpha/beta fold hydrolase [Streptomyces alboniger]QEV16644.1 thioesterase [Streptomyces alboniger]